MEMNLEDPFTRAIFAVISGAFFLLIYTKQCIITVTDPNSEVHYKFTRSYPMKEKVAQENSATVAV